MFQTPTNARTLYDKLFDEHIVKYYADGTCLLYIDRHLVHEVSSPQAFDGLRRAGRSVRRPECILATADHNVPTTSRLSLKSTLQFIKDDESRVQYETLEKNVADFDLFYFGLSDRRQGIVHVIGPEQGFTIPGTTVVCGDSHTSTHGAFGALAFGIGTSDVEHVLATQTLLQKRSKNMKVEVNGQLLPGTSAKDIILHIIGKIGTAGATGYVMEFCGSVIEDLSMEARMTICNMSIEAGAKAGLIAPDEGTIQYVRNRPLTLALEQDLDCWAKATDHWRHLHSDEDAHWDLVINIDADAILPTVSWGTSPEQVTTIDQSVPAPSEFTGDKKLACEHALRYMGLSPGIRMTDIQIDMVFIGSCTNSRIEDIRLVAYLVNNKQVSGHVRAIVVPGSGLVKQQAEEEGLNKILMDAGFEWRESGCSMCVALNDDVLSPDQRCASTTNRNFEGRQGPHGRTHLVSPALAAAAALKGRLADVREIEGYKLAIARSSKGSTVAKIQVEQKPLRDTKFEALPHSPPTKDLIAPNGRQKFSVLKGFAAVLDRSNIDTDVILPKQFCKTITRAGLSRGLFFDWRFDEQGYKKREFVLNKTPYNQAKILLAGSNFGCGSSREHAPWALLDFGIRCIIASSFGEIFYNNAFKNGMLPLTLEQDIVTHLMREAETGRQLQIDLHQNCIQDDGGRILTTFKLDEHLRHRLLNGIDDIATTLLYESDICRFEAERSLQLPWLDGPCRGVRQKRMRVLKVAGSSKPAALGHGW